MTRVVLFGAGASFGAGGVFPTHPPPPLGNQLFAELARCYPGSWGALPSDIGASFKDNFEVGMGILWERYSTVIPDLMQQMALYFVQFRPRSRGSTLYCSLAKEIKQRGLAGQLLLSTLNYECLLELAISRQSMRVNYGHFPAPDEALTVWKLHGSCNFLPVGIRAGRGVKYSRDVTFNTRVEAVEDLNEVVRFCLSDNALPPVMCLFMEGKPTQIAPGSVVAMQEAWRAIVANADEVAVVGVYPNPADAYLWDALATTPGPLLYIGNKSAFDGWAGEHRSQGESRYISAKFDEGFEQLVDEVLR